MKSLNTSLEFGGKPLILCQGFGRQVPISGIGTFAECQRVWKRGREKGGEGGKEKGEEKGGEGGKWGGRREEEEGEEGERQWGNGRKQGGKEGKESGERQRGWDREEKREIETVKGEP